MEEVLQPQLVNDHGVQLDKEPNSARQLHILYTRLGLDIALHAPPGLWKFSQKLLSKYFKHKILLFSVGLAMEELGSQSDNLLLDEQQKGLYIILL